MHLILVLRMPLFRNLKVRSTTCLILRRQVLSTPLHPFLALLCLNRRSANDEAAQQVAAADGAIENPSSGGLRLPLFRRLLGTLPQPPRR